MRLTIEQSHDCADRMVCYAELEALRNEYTDYKDVRLYPFETNIIVKLISSMLFPFAIAVIQVYLPVIMNLNWIQRNKSNNQLLIFEEAFAHAK